MYIKRERERNRNDSKGTLSECNEKKILQLVKLKLANKRGIGGGEKIPTNDREWFKQRLQ
jgi:hypothetical protein